ncbi:copine 8 [Trichuris trichiura]|uniref:Copine 8 n=1 Tax=Trichuris trichiura TaxID=36087 RepID=A0A077ZL23_TRITR|nr:copine 8 [Trichuris trichiura]
MCVMFKQSEQGNWQEAERSEVMRNNLNPDFVHKFTIDYEFEARQSLKFEIYDVDSACAKLEKHDFLGRVECTLAELVSEPRVPATIGMPITAEEQIESKEEVSFNIRAEDLDNKRFLRKSSPQLAIYRVNEDTSWTIVYRTEVAKHCLNPVWQPFSLGTSQLCCSDHYRLVLALGDTVSPFRTIHPTYTINREVISFAIEKYELFVFQLINGQKKRKKAIYENSGKIIIKTSITVVDSFLDYVKAGTHLSCAFAIDFTASNGDPRKAQSLHYFHPYLLNPYQMAIRAVGDIVKDYDSDKLFPVLGFGARLAPDGRVSHDFNPTDPFCIGIEGVLQAYGTCLQKIWLAGPTHFAPIISHVARLASAHMDGSKYFILLIITDGVISDMPKTQEAIIDASTLPLSLIIVGVGEGDFTEMRILDGDKVRLSSKGKTVERDIVQFVSMRDFTGNMAAQSSELTAARLSREVLAEIPFQFLSFMKSKHITSDDVRKMNRCDKAPQHVFKASVLKGLNTPPEAPPP